MKYHMIAYVTVSAASERDAYRMIERQIDRCGPSLSKSEVTFEDAEAQQAEPECADCGTLLPAGSTDYTLCPPCAQAEQDAEAQYQKEKV